MLKDGEPFATLALGNILFVLNTQQFWEQDLNVNPKPEIQKQSVNS